VDLSEEEMRPERFVDLDGFTLIEAPPPRLFRVSDEPLFFLIAGVALGLLLIQLLAL
jgi:hypothetical protein